MRKKTKIVLWILGGLFLLFVGWIGIYLLVKYEPDLDKGWTAGPDAAPTRVLVATSGSAFKRAVAKRVADSLAADGRRVRVEPLAALPDLDPAGFHAVVIMGSCEGWRLGRKAGRFLSRHTNHARHVLVVTSGPGTWKPERWKLDAVTSASRPGDETRVADAVLAKVRAIR